MQSMNNEKKRILMICNYFAPDNAVAAIRLTKFAKYLSEYGYEVDVLTEYKKNQIEDEILANDAKSIKVHYVYLNRIRRRLINICFAVMKPIKDPLFNDKTSRTLINPETGLQRFMTFEERYPLVASIDYFTYLSIQKGLFRSAKRFLRVASGYDYCFATYGNSFGPLAGLFYKKHHPETKLIADFRDPVYQKKFTPKYAKRRARHFEEKIHKNCDHIITVTEKMKEDIPVPYQEKACCITNGYDQNDRAYCTGSSKTADKMTLCYTGVMYGGLRDFSAVFRVINELIVENSINPDKIEIRYAGPESSYIVFWEQARRHSIDGLCKYYGKTARVVALELQSSSDILLLSTEGFKDNNTGWITGKALEYMSANKPVITIISGDIERNAHELGVIVDKARLGCLYYESANEEDYEKLKDYVLLQYNEILANGRVIHNPDEDAINQFSYGVLTSKLIKKLDGLK